MSILDIPQSTQLSFRPGIIELNWGQPDPTLLPVEAVSRASVAMLSQLGGEALSYGASAGAGPLIAWIRDRIQAHEGQPITNEEIAISAGNSDAVDQICTLFTQPGEVVLVESPTYHLALRIIHDHKLNIVPIPIDAQGLQVELLAAKVRELKSQGQTVRMLYTIPTYHNPTGICLSDDRRRTLIDLAIAEDFLIVEDDVYRELGYDDPPPPSLWSLAPRGRVLRLGSFAKTLAPGLRLGWINGSVEQIAKIADCGLRDSGGGLNHFTAMAIGQLCVSGDFDVQLEKFRTAYRQRRDTLVDALIEHLPRDCKVEKPAGGFFVWVTLPSRVDAATLLTQAEAAGVAYIPGIRFHYDGRGANTLRLAFSLYPPEELAKGAERLGQAIKSVQASL